VTVAVVPIAGRGTRLLPATRAVPKALLPLVDRPVIDLVLEELSDNGIRKVVLVVGEMREAIEAHVDSGSLEIAWVDQPEPLGLGDAVARGAEAVADEPFVVALGDALIDASGQPARLISRLLDSFAQRADTAAALAVESVEPDQTSSYGIVDCPPEGGEVMGLVEKPDPAKAPSNLAVAGRYVIAPGVLPAISPGRDGEVQLTDALNSMCNAGRRLVAVPLEPGERRLDVGDAYGYAAAFVDRALHDPRFGFELRARAARER
jgi:UTP--glucose-1-phosphate uridylyltransferase